MIYLFVIQATCILLLYLQVRSTSKSIYLSAQLFIAIGLFFCFSGSLLINRFVVDWQSDSSFVLDLIIASLYTTILLPLSFQTRLKHLNFAGSSLRARGYSLQLFILLIFIATPVLSFLYAYGFSPLLSNRISKYLEVAESSGSFLYLLQSTLILVAPPLIYVSLRNSKNYTLCLFLALFSFLYLLIFTHSRYFLASYFLSLLLSFDKFRKPLYLLPLAAILLPYFAILNYIRNGTFEIYLSSMSNLGWKDSILGFVDQFAYAASGPASVYHHVFQLLNKSLISYDFGYQFFVSFPVSLIPRYFWPDKPITSYFWRITKIVEGVYPGPGVPVETSTIYGEGYHQLGIIGVFGVVLVFVWLSSVLLLSLNTNLLLRPLYLFNLFQIPMQVRGSLSSYIYFFLQMLIIAFLVILISDFRLSPFKFKTSSFSSISLN